MWETLAMEEATFSQNPQHPAPVLSQPPPLPPHGLTAAQMAALTAICDTLLPSLTPPLRTPIQGAATVAPEASNEKLHDQTNGCHGSRPSLNSEAAVASFYELSASQAGVPDKVAGLMRWRLKGTAMSTVGTILWLLSTRPGTLLLAGSAALTRTFPFCQPFASLPRKQQEAALSAWALSLLIPLRTIFKVFKTFTISLFFTAVDAEGRNVTWEALGYPGPEPAPAATPHQQLPGTGSPRPLEHAVVDVGGGKASRATIASALSQRGFQVADRVSTSAGLALPQKQALAEIGEQVLVVKCDAVVVGSGSGGGVVAAVLAQAGLKVLVLEKGGYFAGQDFSLLEGPSMSTLYDKGGFLATEDGSLALLAGSCVGGGSLINWAAAYRTPAHVTEEWASSYGLSRFAGEDFQRAASAVCERLHVGTADTQDNMPNATLRKGAEKLGLPVSKIPRNVVGPHSCGWCGFGCRSGAKQSTAATWLVDAANAGAVILSGCKAEQVLHAAAEGAAQEGPASKPNSGAAGQTRVVRGVLATSVGGGQTFQTVIEAPTVIVAAGSVQTPALLLQSQLAHPALGKTLRVHPVTVVWGYFPESDGSSLSGSIFEGAIMTACCTAAANWETTGYGCILQTPSLHPGLFAVAVPWTSAREYKELVTRFARTVCIIIITRDSGCGSVRLDANGEAAIEYTMTSSDIKHMQDGMMTGLRILRAAGAAEVGTLSANQKPCTSHASEAEFEAYLQDVHTKGIKKNDTPLFSAHQTGSCRMGTQSSGSFCNPECESWEVRGLYIGDGSVLPTAPGVNPMITIQSVAYQTAHLLAKRLRGLP